MSLKLGQVTSGLCKQLKAVEGMVLGLGEGLSSPRAEERTKETQTLQAEEEVPGRALLLTSTLASTRGSWRARDLLTLARRPSGNRRFTGRFLEGTISPPASLQSEKPKLTTTEGSGHTTITITALLHAGFHTADKLTGKTLSQGCLTLGNSRFHTSLTQDALLGSCSTVSLEVSLC